MQTYINNNVEATKSDVNELTKDGKVIVSAIYYRINGREVLVIKTNNQSLVTTITIGHKGGYKYD